MRRRRGGRFVPESRSAPGDLDQPDRGLRRFDLAEERAEVGELVAAPVAEQARGLGGHLPLPLRQLSPAVHFLPDRVDDRVGVVLLLGSRKVLLAEGKPELLRLAGLGLRGRHGGDELGGAAGLDDLVGRKPVPVELPVPAGVLVGGVEDRALVESLTHRDGARL